MDVNTSTLDFAELKNIQIQGGKGVKGPSEQIFILVFDVYHVRACDLKISIYNVNSSYKKYVYSLELFRK